MHQPFTPHRKRDIWPLSNDSRGADVNIQGYYYRSGLQGSVNVLHTHPTPEGAGNIFKILLDADADINAEGGLQGHALVATCDCRHCEVVDLLLNVM